MIIKFTLPRHSHAVLLLLLLKSLEAFFVKPPDQFWGFILIAGFGTLMTGWFNPQLLLFAKGSQKIWWFSNYEEKEETFSFSYSHSPLMTVLWAGHLDLKPPRLLGTFKKLDLFTFTWIKIDLLDFFCAIIMEISQRTEPRCIYFSFLQ